MIDIKRQIKQFKNHVATITDYGNIKILDFKAPNTSDYRIRFLFEEDYYRLHISGDLGELVASNFKNMTYEEFSDFVNNAEYFEEKIDCHSRPLYVYDAEKAKKDLEELIEEYELEDEITNKYTWDRKTAKEEFINNVLEDFDDNTGIGSTGYSEASKIIPDFFESASNIGKMRTGIIELYMLAFKLAQNQLKLEGVKHE